MNWYARLSKFIMLAGILQLFLFTTQIFGREVVRLTTGEWSPYISEELENKGLIAQIASEAFALQDVEVKLFFFPWQRVYQLSKTGEYDGTLAYARTVEREKFYYYSEPVYTGKYVLFHLKAQPFKWDKYEDLKDIRIAATRGFGGMGKEFIAAEEKKVIHVERLASDIQSFHMLFLGRVQAVASDMEVGYVLLKKNFPAKEISYVTHNDHIIQTAKYHLVLANNLKKNEGLIKKFNLGLAQLRKSGRYDQIIKDFYQKKVYKEAVPSKLLTYD
ncbi:hypothetical protein DOM21_12675 [Bacteriovorax stolpii]|uniref:substrate-binding periplasmic protein n=1 Tax=Bacteriovorax stolpii TaxID=960 RepID=UPI001158B6A0|nr:transporter substrate-binding domain-containing protein [Bacteriovorax stolpii]QDK42281.1 hypothetical protein DOM21_12675 [Bacteriovorax stolpii]